MDNHYFNTLFVGKVAIELDSVDSTNRYAKELISKSNPIEGTAIIAGEQLEGKGQMGTTWQSAPGENLTLSLILRPSFLLAQAQFQLSAVVALALCELVQDICKKQVVKIKWPNDIYIGNKKVAGILIENTLRQQYLDYCVLGIGLNVNQTLFDPSLANPTSLALELQEKFEIKKIAFQLFHHLERHYLKLKAGKAVQLVKDYTNCLYQLNEEALYFLPETEKEQKGIIRGVDSLGRLILETEERFQVFSLKELIFLKK